MSTTADQVKAALNMNLGATTNILKKEKADEKEAAAIKNKAASFHGREQARKAKMTDDRMANAQAAGSVKVATFFDKLHNSAHPDHTKTVQDFKNLYGSSEGKARSALMAKAMEEYDCAPIENRDLAFESKTLEANRPKNNATKTDLAHYNILKDSLNSEWQQRGYKGTQSVIDGWKAKYK
jgi:hypothetical protein